MKKESTFSWTSLFLEARAEILKNVLLVFSILVETMIPKGHFEINLPLWNSLYSRKKQIFGKPPFTFECVLKCKNIVSNSWFTTLCEKVKSISNVFYDYLLWGVHCYTRGNYNIGTWQSSRLLLSWRSAIFLPKQNCCFYFRAIFKFEWQCFSLSSPMLRFHGIFLFCRKSGFILLSKTSESPIDVYKNCCFSISWPDLNSTKAIVYLCVTVFFHTVLQCFIFKEFYNLVKYGFHKKYFLWNPYFSRVCKSDFGSLINDNLWKISLNTYLLIFFTHLSIWLFIYISGPCLNSTNPTVWEWPQLEKSLEISKLILKLMIVVLATFGSRWVIFSFLHIQLFFWSEFIYSDQSGCFSDRKSSWILRPSAFANRTGKDYICQQTGCNVIFFLIHVRIKQMAVEFYKIGWRTKAEGSGIFHFACPWVIDPWPFIFVPLRL